MKRIWLFVPDIFLSLLIIVSCERVSLDQEREKDERAVHGMSQVEVQTENEHDWNKELAEYKVRAKKILKRIQPH